MDNDEIERQRASVAAALTRLSTSEARRQEEERRKASLKQREERRLAREQKIQQEFGAIRQREAAALQLQQIARRELEEARIKQQAQRLKSLLVGSWPRRIGYYKGQAPAYEGPRTWGKLDPDALARRARSCPPDVSGNWVTDFSDWVFDLEYPSRSHLSLVAGKNAEKRLVTAVADAARARNRLREFPPALPGWRVLYFDNLTPDSRGFPASKLRVGGKPLFGKPDLVLEEVRTGEIFVVDRKASNRSIPTNCWNNVRAQLWAYSHLDEWVDRPKVTLCAEVWRFAGDGDPSEYVIFSWLRTNERLAAGMTELFSIYGGQIT